MQRDLEIPAPMTPPDVAEVKELQAGKTVRVAPNKPLAVVVSDDKERRDQRPRRPNRHNGDRSGAQTRGSRPNRGRPQSRRAS